MSSATDGLGHAVSPAPLTVEEAERLWRLPDIIALGARADEVRRKRHGDRATFVRVATLALDTAVDAEWPVGARELRIDGRPRDMTQAERVVAGVVRRAAGTPVTAFSLADLRAVAPDGRSFADALARLFGNGLSAIACADVDGLEGLRRSIDAVLSAGGSIARFTVLAVPAAVPVHLFAEVRALQKATGAVRAFAPLPRQVVVSSPTTGYDDVKAVALARLLLDNVDSIQVSWALHGPKLAQVALLFGADDLDDVSAEDTSPDGRRRAPLEEVQRNIRAASLTPVERDGRFGVVGR